MPEVVKEHEAGAGDPGRDRLDRRQLERSIGRAVDDERRAADILEMARCLVPVELGACWSNIAWSASSAMPTTSSIVACESGSENTSPMNHGTKAG